MPDRAADSGGHPPVTTLERFKAICRFERPNDPFLWSVAAWNETLDRWVAEGMPVSDLSTMRQTHDLLMGPHDRNAGIAPVCAIHGMGKCGNPPWIVAVDPLFERRTLEDDGTHIVYREWDGTVVRRGKAYDNAIPQYLSYPVTDRASWREFKKRLDPHSSGRWPKGWEYMRQEKISFALKPGQDGRPWSDRDFPLGMNLLSLYGNIRNYMGLENLSMAIFDDPSLVDEMLEWQMYMALEMAKRVFTSGVTLDWVWLWEDMAFNKGPLVSPQWVREHMMPRYRPVVQLLRDHGVSALILDCDGNIDELMPLWVDCGINATYPLECAAGMDARTYRTRFGRDLVIFGNVDKRCFAAGKAAIDAEVGKVKDLISHGGYFPNADHHIPPDAPYEAVKYWLNEVRKLGAYPELRYQVP
jgi:uroporphyrinogen decarboxylase